MEIPFNALTGLWFAVGACTTTVWTISLCIDLYRWVRGKQAEAEGKHAVKNHELAAIHKRIQIMQDNCNALWDKVNQIHKEIGIYNKYNKKD